MLHIPSAKNLNNHLILKRMKFKMRKKLHLHYSNPWSWILMLLVSKPNSNRGLCWHSSISCQAKCGPILYYEFFYFYSVTTNKIRRSLSLSLSLCLCLCLCLSLSVSVSLSLSVSQCQGLRLDSNQGILKGESITVPLTSCLTDLESAVWNCNFLFLFAIQTNPNQSNRRSMVQWYFPL